MWQNLLTSDEIETESKNNWARNWAKIHETQKLSTNFACLGWKAGAQGGHKHRTVDTLFVVLIFFPTESEISSASRRMSQAETLEKRAQFEMNFKIK